MKRKEGTKLSGITSEIVLALLLTERVYQKFGAELVITSLNDGKHLTASLHYSGKAFDARTRDIEPDKRKDLAEAVHEALGNEFDVVLESDHLHVEFQPK